MSWHSHRPVSVAWHGWLRTTPAQPTRSSSRRMRCDTADGVTCNARGARSKLPSGTTAASADSDEQSSIKFIFLKPIQERLFVFIIKD
jgi:hypothetical protein